MNDSEKTNIIVFAVSQAVLILIKALEVQGVDPKEVLNSITAELDRIQMQAVKDADSERAVFTSASDNDKPNP